MYIIICLILISIFIYSLYRAFYDNEFVFIVLAFISMIGIPFIILACVYNHEQNIFYTDINGNKKEYIQVHGVSSDKGGNISFVDRNGVRRSIRISEMELKDYKGR